MILPARCNENARQHLKVMGDLGQIVNLDYSIRDDDAIKYAVERSNVVVNICLLYTSPSPRDATLSRMPSSA